MLHAAIAKNNWEEVHNLLNISYINVNERDKILQTPLHAVCTTGQRQIAEALLQKGAEVNAVDTNNWAPIHCAASNCQLDLVDYLLDHPKIDLSILSKDGTSMFHYMMRNRVDASKKEKYVSILSKAKQKGADISLHGKHLETPLHRATARSNHYAIQFLLDNNASINAQNKLGETALHYAVQTKDVNLVKFFLQNGADLSIRSKDGTALDVADEDVKKVLQGGVDSSFKLKVQALQPNEIVSSAPQTKLEDNTTNTIDENQLAIQKLMMQKYMAQATENGNIRPSSLPIFCKHCLRPFAYPIHAISIKCPMCLTVNSIPGTSM